MNHAGEITPLTKLVRPHVAVVTGIEPVHLEFFDRWIKLLTRRRKYFLASRRAARLVLNRDNAQFVRLVSAAKSAGIQRVVSFGEDGSAEARLLRVSLQPD